jgi:hypothetical protein
MCDALLPHFPDSRCDPGGSGLTHRLSRSTYYRPRSRPRIVKKMPPQRAPPSYLTTLPSPSHSRSVRPTSAARKEHRRRQRAKARRYRPQTSSLPFVDGSSDCHTSHYSTAPCKCVQEGTLCRSAGSRCWVGQESQRKLPLHYIHRPQSKQTAANRLQREPEGLQCHHYVRSTIELNGD